MILLEFLTSSSFLFLSQAMQETAILASSSSSSGEGEVFFLAAPFVVGGIVWAAIYRRYRNQDKSFLYEHETNVTVTNIDKTEDTYQGARKRLKSKRINGDNSRNSRERVQRFEIE